MLLKTEEIAKLKVKSKYDDEQDDWIVPPFVLRGKELALPKVNGKRVMEWEMDERDMHIMDDTPDNTYGSN